MAFLSLFRSQPPYTHTHHSLLRCFLTTSPSPLPLSTISHTPDLPSITTVHADHRTSMPFVPIAAYATVVAMLLLTCPAGIFYIFFVPLPCEPISFLPPVTESP
ncbi:hypothetical protein V6Z12_A08G086500 [Gossypium hirsutum]